MRLGKKFRRIVPIYLYFARHWNHCVDSSDEALQSLYEFETFGRGRIAPNNIFAIGKKWMDVTVAMWLEDLGTTLTVSELKDDPELPDWWLEKVLPK